MRFRRTELVNSKALDKLINYADDVRVQRDQEFCASTAEDEESEAEFDALVKALRRREVAP